MQQEVGCWRKRRALTSNGLSLQQWYQVYKGVLSLSFVFFAFVKILTTIHCIVAEFQPRFSTTYSQAIRGEGRQPTFFTRITCLLHYIFYLLFALLAGCLVYVVTLLWLKTPRPQLNLISLSYVSRASNSPIPLCFTKLIKDIAKKA